MYTKDEAAAYMRKYRKERHAAKRLAAILRLGGVCAQCKSDNVDDLQIDHIDRTQTLFRVPAGFYQSKALQEAEINKCQLLCKACHLTKSLAERGQTSAKGRHGTLSTYRYCKCEVCRAAAAAHALAYKHRTGRSRPESTIRYEHGTRAMYVTKKCRCPSCTEANRVYHVGLRSRR